MVYTFLGSSFFHASLAFIPEWVDLSAVYAVTAVPIAYNLQRICNSYGLRWSVWIFVGAWLAWALFSSIFTWEMKAHIAMPSMIVLMVLTMALAEWRIPGKVPWRWIAGMAFATLVGILTFIGDIDRIGCDPDGWIHPHGLWHLASAAGAGSYYGYMRASS